MIELREANFRVLSSILSNISAGLLLLPLTISIASGNFQAGILTISLALAIIYYGFAVKIENFLEDI